MHYNDSLYRLDKLCKMGSKRGETSKRFNDETIKVLDFASGKVTYTEKTVDGSKSLHYLFIIFTIILLDYPCQHVFSKESNLNYDDGRSKDGMSYCSKLTNNYSKLYRLDFLPKKIYFCEAFIQLAKN